MKTTRIPALFTLALAGFAGLAATGCDTVDHRNAAASASATDTRASYGKLDTTLSAAIARLQSLHETPGAPEAFASAIKDVRSDVKSAADTTASARETLRSDGEKQVARLQKAAQDIADPDLAKNYLSVIEALRGHYGAYDKESAALADHLAAGDAALGNVIVAAGSNPTAEVVKLTQDSIVKAIDAFEAARKDIPAARKALRTLREKLPAVAK